MADTPDDQPEAKNGQRSLTSRYAAPAAVVMTAALGGTGGYMLPPVYENVEQLNEFRLTAETRILDLEGQFNLQIAYMKGETDALKQQIEELRTRRREGDAKLSQETFERVTLLLDQLTILRAEQRADVRNLLYLISQRPADARPIEERE